MRRSLNFVLALMFTVVLHSRAYAMGADHPADRAVNLQDVPPGLNDLINQTNRVHGFFVNAEDRFFFAGDTIAFSAFLKQYATLEGIAGHRLIIHRGKGQAKSPWDKGDGKACDWMLNVAPVSWIEGHREVFRDAAGDASRTEKPKYLAEAHVWTAGSVDLDKVSIPDGIHVVRQESPAAPEKKADQPSHGTR